MAVRNSFHHILQLWPQNVQKIQVDTLRNEEIRTLNKFRKSGSGTFTLVIMFSLLNYFI